MSAASWDPGRNALMLGELRMPTIGRLWPEFAERSDKEGWPAARFLGGLLEHEVAKRAKRRIERHRIESQLNPAKTLASFEFAEVPMLSKAHVMALASGDAWLDRGATVLIFGPRGAGKSHIGCGIGHALIDAGYRVLYRRTSEPDHSQPAVLGRDNVFPDPGMTVAAIDRLVHHSTIFELHQVESYRGKQAARQQKTQRDNDKANRRRQPPSDNDNHPQEPTT